MRRLSLLLAVVWLLAAPIAWAQIPVPDEALAAEMAERWDDALAIYRRMLVSDPGRTDLWVRVADIEALRGNVAITIRALEHAAAASPDNAELYRRLSQAHAATGNAVAALEAIDQAVDRQPDNVEYLEARATLSTWSGDYHGAQDSYRRLRELESDVPDLSLRLARVDTWAGDTDHAVEEYRRYLEAEPGAADVWLELAQAESWRGNYRAALSVLQEYEPRFGRSAAFSRALADVLARADRPSAAIDLLRPLIADEPDSYELKVSQTIAQAVDGEVRGAREGLDSIRQLRPDAEQTRAAEQLVRNLVGSTFDPGANLYSDSDGLRIERVAPQGTLALVTGTRITAGYERQALHAQAGTGLEQTTGETSASTDRFWGDVAQRIGRAAVRGQVGQADTGTRTVTIYAAGLEVKPTDTISLVYDWSSGLLVISPRTVGLGLTRKAHAGRITWNPTVGSHIGVDVSRETISDGNRRWFFALSPRQSLVRNQRMNLDLGLSIRQMRVAEDLDHGYYDPARFESYEVAAFPYFKLSPNTGLGLSIGVGVQRDSTSSFHFGGDAAVEATIGIYRRWAVRLNASGTLNQRLESGAYQGLGGGVVLMRRF